MQKSISLCKKPRREVCFKKNSRLLSGCFQLSGHRSLKKQLIYLLTVGHCTAGCGSALLLHMFWSRSPTWTRRPSSHRGPEAAGWISRCSGPWSTTAAREEERGGKEMIRAEEAANHLHKKCRSKLDLAGKVQQERRGTMQRWPCQQHLN